MLFVSTDGLDGAIEKLQLLQSKGRDLTPLFRFIGEDEVARTVMRFESESAPDGRKWQDIERDGQILSDTGLLKNSIRYLLDGDSVTVGTSVEYGAFHQFGTKHMIARPFLGVSNDLTNSIKEAVSEFFTI